MAQTTKEFTRVRFTEEAQKDIKLCIQVQLDSLNRQLQIAQNDLEELCKRTQYKPIVDRTAKTVQDLKTTFREMADIALDDWLVDTSKDGTNLVSYAKRYECGEESEAVAAELNDYIFDACAEFWNEKLALEAVELTSTLTEECTAEALQKCAEIYATCVKALEEQKVRVMNDYSPEGAGNAFENIGVSALYIPLVGIYEAVIKCLDASAKGTTQGDISVLANKDSKTIDAGTYSKEQVDIIKNQEMGYPVIYKSLD